LSTVSILIHQYYVIDDLTVAMIKVFNSNAYHSWLEVLGATSNIVTKINNFTNKR
jgi:hypothetical protein